MLVIVTGADHIKQETAIIRRERYIEYMLSLSRIFSYDIPVAGVLSEFSPAVDSPPFDTFPFLINEKLRLGELDGYNKSQKEFIAIGRLLTKLADKDIANHTFIIKASGRYLLTDDSFVRLVKASSDSPTDAIIRLCDNDTQMYTFLFALRYNYFKEFYAQGISILDGNKNVERAVLEFLMKKGLLKKTLRVNHLGILANINNENTFVIY